MSFQGLYATDYEAPVDFHALREERLRRTRDAMARAGVDALLLAKQANVRYVTGARNLDVMGRGAGLPNAVVTAAAEAPFVWGSTPDDVPPSVPRDHIFPLIWHPVKHIGQIVNLLGNAVKGRIAVDAVAPYFVTALSAMVPNVNLVDANEVMHSARKVKTADEVACLRIAHRVCETAMDKALARLRPGVRDIDLHGMFLEETAKRGMTFPISTGVYAAQPKERTQAPWAIDGAPPYRQLAADAVFGEGELVTIETGAFYLGYLGLFGRTWHCSFNARPTAAQKDLYLRWRQSFQRIAEQCRPGRSVADLRKAGGEAAANAPRYLVHGVGLGFEPPVVARGLTPELEQAWALEPGIVLTVAPYVWQEGTGGFRAAETLLITEAGHEQLTQFPHGPLAE